MRRTQDVSADKNQMKAVCVRLELLLCGQRRVSVGTRQPPRPHALLAEEGDLSWGGEAVPSLGLTPRGDG